MTVDVPPLHGAEHVCEVCGHPDTGLLRCPHAIDSRYPCPEAPVKRIKGNNPYTRKSRRN